MLIHNFFTIVIHQTSDRLPSTYTCIELLQQKGGSSYKVIESFGDGWVGAFTSSIKNLPMDVAKPIYESLKTLVGKTINEHEVLV